MSLPYYGCRPLLRRSVESILGQTHGDLTLIVLNDGEEPPPWDLLADIHDRRLIRFDLDANRGRYFADAVTLAATPDRYLLIQDADDWSSPDRATLLYEALREDNAGAAFSAVNEYVSGHPRTRRYPQCTQPPPPRLHHLTKHVGLYQTAALRQLGGYYAGFRFGYDTLLVGLLTLTARLAYVDLPLYHHDLRAGSLRNSLHTGMASAARRTVRLRLEALYDQAYRGFGEYVAGRCGLPDLCHLIAGLASSGVTADEARALGAQAGRLRAQLVSRDSGRPVSTRPAADVAVAPKPFRAARPARPPGPGKPDVSVVIPTRHDTHMVAPTIKSFLATRSRETRLEFIVVDDASPGGVNRSWLQREVGVDSEDSPITVVRPAEHAGIVRARNLGARYARADWLFITDAHVRVETGWDTLIMEYAGPRRVLAATIVSDQVGGRGFGASLRMPALTISWNAEPAGDPGAVQVAASAGMAVDRKLFWKIGGFDPGMIMYGSAEAEFSVRAWLRGAEVLNLPPLLVHHRFRSAREREGTLTANLHFVLHNRLRFALLYLPNDLVLGVVRDMALRHPAWAVAQACDMVASSDAWQRRLALREQEVLSFGWFARKFGLDVRSAS